MKGIIALDIDGTLVGLNKTIPEDVCDYLSKLSLEGWSIIFITGRTLTFAKTLFRALTFPYYVAVQNGASVVKMPESKPLFRFYLDESVMIKMEPLCKKYRTDIVIASGHENEDKFYYRPKNYSEISLNYLLARAKNLGENWIPVDTFPVKGLKSYASLKCFGDKQTMTLMSDLMQREFALDAPVIKDPYNNDYYITQATHHKANKGEALTSLSELLKIKYPLIAAGDDYNDLSMLKKADIKIVVKGAPKELVNIANIHSEGPDNQGIVDALKQAINLLDKGK